MNTKKITTITKYCLYALILFAGINIISNFMQISLLSSYFVYSEFSDDVFSVLADKNDTRVLIIDSIYGLLIVSSFFIIGRWVYSSAKINQLLEVKGLKFSPAWSIGWHLIPIANLFKPYQALKEIYKASFNKEDWENEEIPTSFGAWWTTWIIGNIFSNASMRMWFRLGEDMTHEDMAIMSYLDICSDFFQIICSLALLNIIDSISKNHQSIQFKTKYEQEETV